MSRQASCSARLVAAISHRARQRMPCCRMLRRSTASSGTTAGSRCKLPVMAASSSSVGHALLATTEACRQGGFTAAAIALGSAELEHCSHASKRNAAAARSTFGARRSLTKNDDDAARGISTPDAVAGSLCDSSKSSVSTICAAASATSDVDRRLGGKDEAAWPAARAACSDTREADRALDSDTLASRTKRSAS